VEQNSKLLKELTQLVISPRNASKTALKKVMSDVREILRSNLYPDRDTLDNLICKHTGMKVAPDSLSKWVSRL
jgi:hypothetical protein